VNKLSGFIIKIKKNIHGIIENSIIFILLKKHKLMKKALSIFFTISLLALIISCGSQQEKEIVILHTNDMHAKIHNMDKLSAYKKELEKKYDDVILVSAGDIFSGNPVVDVYKEKGYPMIDLMNKTGYQMSTLGNHEFDYGQKTLKKRIDDADFPFICANIDTKNSALEPFKPYKVIKTNGISLFFLGLIETWNDGLPSTHPEKVKELTFKNPLDAVENYIPEAKKHNLFIGLTHLGYKTDKHLIEKYPQLDLVIGGHSHTLVKKPEKYKETLLTQAGDDLNYVGKVIISVKNKKITGLNAEIIDLKNFNKKDEKITALIKKYNNNKSLNKVIGKATSPIKGKEELGALFTDAQCAVHNLDFSFQNNGGIRISEIPKGEIRVKTIYELDPFGNELIKMKMKPLEIKSLIRYGYEERSKSGLRIGGGTYTLYLDKNDNLQKIEIRDEEGNTLHPDSTYTVGLNSYITSSYDFKHRDEGESLYVTTAENIIKYIKERKTIDYTGEKRTFFKNLK
jgi:2',3'-cyclic-nucleotide 2'-phosphodiesterase (5'-nucleotidase family)